MAIPSKGALRARSGRPTLYRPEFAEQAAKLCHLGATDMELADFFGVDTSTIYRWRNTHEEFCNAVMAGKDKADERVVRALFNRAVGYSFESEKVFQHQGTIVRAGTREHVPPDPGAALNWLKNRRPDEWRDKSQLEHSGPGGGPIAHSFDPKTMTDDQLAAIAMGEGPALPKADKEPA